MLEIELTNQQTEIAIDTAQLISAARTVLEGEGIRNGNLSLAIIDASTMHRLNRQYLNHDDVTDVLSFPFSHDDDALDGEIVICAKVASAKAQQYGWQIEHELMLYAVHGALHLVGYDDKTRSARQAMQVKEQHYLAHFDLAPLYNPVHRTIAPEESTY